MQGRAFSKETPSDVSGAFIFNEAAIAVMEMDEPVGKRFTDRTIIGIAKDAHIRALHHKIEPRVFLLGNPAQASERGSVLVKVNGEKVQEAITYIKNVWEEFNNTSPFEYHFLNERYENLYVKEKQIGKIISYFTFLAIFISCLGLFGLASYMSENRMKEVGIRKVLGASVGTIVLMFVKEFAKWVLIANIFAWPIGYVIMAKILQNYAYKISITWDIFIFSGMIAFLIALLTVIFQALKGSLINPVNALRYE